MTFLYLIIIGIVLLGHNLALLGIISLVVALVASKSTERTWAIILGVILMFSGAWFLAGLIGVLVVFLDDDPRVTRRR